MFAHFVCALLDFVRAIFLWNPKNESLFFDRRLYVTLITIKINRIYNIYPYKTFTLIMICLIGSILSQHLLVYIKSMYDIIGHKKHTDGPYINLNHINICKPNTIQSLISFIVWKQVCQPKTIIFVPYWDQSQKW